jgi:hypothetical protein
MSKEKAKIKVLKEIRQAEYCTTLACLYTSHKVCGGENLGFYWVFK